MTQYLDMTQTAGCVAIIPENGETVVLTGVSVYSMPLSVKRKESEIYDDFAQKYGIHFIFDDCIPEIDFYAIPKIEIAATDNDGGFIALPLCRYGWELKKKSALWALLTLR